MFFKVRLLKILLLSWVVCPSVFAQTGQIEASPESYARLLEKFSMAESSTGYSDLTSQEQFYLCKHLMDTVSSRVRKLAKYNREPGMINSSKLGSILKFSHRDCESSDRRYDALKAINNSFNDHKNKIGVILPLNGPYSQLARATLEGLKAAAANQRVNFDRFFVVLDSSTTEQGTEAAISKLLFTHNVSIVVGGLTKIEANVLQNYSKYLRFPTLTLNPNKETYLDNKNGFQIFPNQRNQAEAILANWQAQGVKAAAILRPSHGASDDLADSLIDLAPGAGITIVDDVHYLAGDYPQMNLAVERLFQLTLENKTTDRRVEFEDLLKEKEEEAKKQNLAFNPDRILLPPKVTFDAVLIPDDFRVLRHFIKLFKFHNVEEIKIAGNHMWRSPEIYKPWDPFLNNSFFVDFIGKYNQLPIRPQPYPGVQNIKQKNFFIHPEQVVEFDYKLIGFRSSEISMDVLRLRVDHRRDIAARMHDMKNSSRHWKTLSQTFNKVRSANWSISSFAIGKEGISTIPTHNLQKMNPAQVAPRFVKPIINTSLFKPKTILRSQGNRN